MALPELLAETTTPGVLTSLGTLTAELTEGGSTAEVSAAAPTALRTPGQFHMLLATEAAGVITGGEEVLVEAPTGTSTSWKLLTRGVESTAMAHPVGTKLYALFSKAVLEALLAAYALLAGRKNTQALAGGTEPGGSLVLKAWEGAPLSGRVELNSEELLPLQTDVTKLGAGPMKRWLELSVKQISNCVTAAIEQITGLVVLTVEGMAKFFGVQYEVEEITAAAELNAKKSFISLIGAKAELKILLFNGVAPLGGQHIVIRNGSATENQIIAFNDVNNGFKFTTGVAVELLPGQVIDLWFVGKRWRNSKI
jgi:hypothetical protein